MITLVVAFFVIVIGVVVIGALLRRKDDFAVIVAVLSWILVGAFVAVMVNHAIGV